MVRALWAGLFGVVLVVTAAGAPIRAGATSYDPLIREEESALPGTAPGGTLFLFHSGTAEVRRSLKVGDLVAVSRSGPEGKVQPVGMIRVVAFVGEYCLKGDVVEGIIKSLDLAGKDHLHYLVIPEALCRQ